MTTITTDTVPQQDVVKAWRLVATFVAGAALAGGIAVGVGVFHDSTPASSHPRAIVQTQSAASDPGCPQLGSPC